MNGEKNTFKVGLLRKQQRRRTGYVFISDERFEKLTIKARKQGAIIVRGGAEIEEYLDLRGAAAETVGNVLYFRQEVTISEILEELRHFEQNRIKLNYDKRVELMQCLNEIDAKKYVLSVAKKYRIPRNEIEETKIQLEEYIRILEGLED